jgi:short subunit dehydrogenase
MSKHAVEALTDALAQEMAPFGVSVSIVEPGSYKSDIFKNEVQRSGTGGQLVELVSHAKDPDEVATAVEQALADSNPKRRYMVVPDAQQAEITIKTQLQQLVQLNEGQPYTYDRATLVKMLDEALVRSRPKTNLSSAQPREAVYSPSSSAGTRRSSLQTKFAALLGSPLPR